MVDNRTRDIEGILLIYYWLKDMGYPVVLSNQINWKDKCFLHNPSVVVLSSAITVYGSVYGAFLDFLTRYSKIAILPQEGAIPKKDCMNALFTGKFEHDVAYTKGVSRIFMWGDQTRQWIEEENIFNPSQTMVTGTPRFDALMLEREEGGRAEKHIGFATSHTHINCYTFANRSDNFMTHLDYRKDSSNGVENYYSQDRHWEDWIWYNCAAFRYECELIKRCAVDLKAAISLRPAPFELVEGYNFFKDKYKNFESRNDYYLSEWVKDIFCMIVYVSTVAVSALAYGVPVISPLKLLGERLYDHIKLDQLISPYFSRFFHFPQNLDEALDMIRSAKAGELPALPEGKKDDLGRYLKSYYDFPRQEPSSLTIARELGRLAEEASRELAPVLEPNVLKNIFYRRARALLKDPYHIAMNIKNGSFKSMQRYHFYPWHLADFIKTRDIWRKLRSRYIGAEGLIKQNG